MFSKFSKPTVTLLDRYVAKQLILMVLFGLLMFTVIWLAPETLFKLTQALMSGKITLWQFGQMVLYDLPETLENSIPMAVLFAAILLFRRLSLDLELITFLNAGVSPARLMVPVVAVGVLFAGLHFVVQELITPVTAPLYDHMQQEAGLKSVKNSNFTFVEKNRDNEWDKFMVIGQIQDFPHELRDFVILYYSRDNMGGLYISRILRSNTGRWDPERKVWFLYDGIDHELSEDGVYHENQTFKEQLVSMSKYPYQLLRFSLKNPMDMGQAKLSQYIHLLKEGGQLQDVGFYAVRLQQKIAFPLAAVFFALVGAFLGIEKTRSRNHYALTFGAILLFVYSISVPFTTNLGSLEVLPSFVVAWIPMGLSLGVAWVLVQFRRLVEG